MKPAIAAAVVAIVILFVWLIGKSLIGEDSHSSVMVDCLQLRCLKKESKHTNEMISLKQWNGIGKNWQKGVKIFLTCFKNSNIFYKFA
ncbi:MAG: hypothetical protein K2N25_05720 [Muribaculaceae bacterium]|nr:hypothetical protein [Muribaculaceae bacterium]